MTRAAIVIPNWNGLAHLPDSLSSLTKQTFTDFETIFVDNGSDDDSVGFVRSNYPTMRIIELGENRGFSAAVNAGISNSNSELVVLLNNDTLVEKTWLENLVRAMDEVPQASFGVSKMLRFYEPDLIDSAADGYSLRKGAGINIGSGEHASKYYRRAWVFGACAAAAIYRRSLFEDIGLYDEEFFLIFEDTDISMRAQVAGHRCLYVPDSIVYHKRGASTALGHPEVEARALRNRLWVAGKNLPFTLFVAWMVPFSIRMALGLWRRFVGRLKTSGSRVRASEENSRTGALHQRKGGFVLNYLVPQLTEGFARLPAKRRTVRRVRRANSLYMLRILNCRHRPLS